MSEEVRQQLERQREQWDAAASGWAKWAPLLEQSAQVVTDELITRAGIEAGARVIDIATGPGEPALTAARVVGEGGRVVATDQAPAMIEVARARALEKGLDNVDFLVTTDQRVDLPDANADAVLSRWGLMFFPEPALALSDFHRLLKPGGGFACAVWGVPPRVPMLSAPMMALMKALELSPPPPGGPGPFALADPKHLASLVNDAGFVDVQVDTSAVEFSYASKSEFMQSLLDLAAPIETMLAGPGKGRRDELIGTMNSALDPFLGADGSVVLPNDVVYASGRKAS